MHKNCITAGVKSCEIGADLFSFLVGKKVDLILQAHDHNYQRGKQLALGGSCAAISAGSFNAGCVVDSGADNAYVKGAGSVLVIAGTFGQGLYDVSTGDAEAGYFARLMGANSNPSKGFVKYQVSATQLSAQFVASSGVFTDSFTIAGDGGSTAPTATDVTVATTANTPATVTLRGTDGETCDLAFTVESQPANGSLSPLVDEPCTPGAPNTDTAKLNYTPNAGFTGTDSFTYQVSDGTTASNLATVTVTVSAGGTGSATFTPIDDASIKRDAPATTFGASTLLEVDRDPAEHFLVKFDTRSLTGAYSSARLRLFNVNASKRGGRFTQAASTWEEEAVTWNNAPAAGTEVASLGRVSGSSSNPLPYEVELRNYISGPGIYSLRVTSTSTDGADYYSKEQGGGFAPQLLVTSSSGPALPTLSINDVSVTEGNAGIAQTAVFTVTLSAPAGGLVTVNFATSNGTATGEVDYDSDDGILTFNPGETTKTISIGILGDTTTEPDETFFVNISAASNATIADGQGVGTIVNDDGTPTTSTFTVGAAADATIKRDTPTSNFGTATSLEVDNSPVMHFLMKFDISSQLAGRTVTSAKLRLRNFNSSSKGGDFHRVGDTTWSETGVTWNNAPGYDAAVFASLGQVAGTSSSTVTYEVDVTSLFTGDADAVVALRVTSTSSDGADYYSKERGSGLAPELVVTVSG